MEMEEMEMSVEEAMDPSVDEDEDVDVDIDENDEPTLVEPADTSTALASAPTSTTAPADPHVRARATAPAGAGAAGAAALFVAALMEAKGKGWEMCGSSFESKYHCCADVTAAAATMAWPSIQYSIAYRYGTTTPHHTPSSLPVFLFYLQHLI